MKIFLWITVVVLCLTHGLVQAESKCPRPEPGGVVEEPQDLRSQNGVLEVRLTANNAPDANKSIRYCYTDAAGHESPNLRVSPGDLVILHLTNALRDLHPDATPMHDHMHAPGTAQGPANPCTSGVMSAVSTNLHFHGL